MRLPRHESLKVAETILRRLEGMGIPGATKENICVRCYSNGREQGYRITVYKSVYWIDCCFALDRGSDSIVLYFSNWNELSPFSLPTDRMYEARERISARTKKLGGPVELAAYRLQKFFRKALAVRAPVKLVKE